MGLICEGPIKKARVIVASTIKNVCYLGFLSNLITTIRLQIKKKHTAKIVKFKISAKKYSNKTYPKLLISSLAMMLHFFLCLLLKNFNFLTISNSLFYDGRGSSRTHANQITFLRQDICDRNHLMPSFLPFLCLFNTTTTTS